MGYPCRARTRRPRATASRTTGRSVRRGGPGGALAVTQEYTSDAGYTFFYSYVDADGFRGASSRPCPPRSASGRSPSGSTSRPSSGPASLETRPQLPASGELAPTTVLAASSSTAGAACGSVAGRLGSIDGDHDHQQRQHGGDQERGAHAVDGRR